MAKQRTMYQVRIFVKGATYSQPVGHKMQLRARTRAGRLVRRLKKSGFDACMSPVRVYC